MDKKVNLLDFLNQIAELRLALQTLKEKGVEIETIPCEGESAGKLPILSKIYYVLDEKSVRILDVGNKEAVEEFIKQVKEGKVVGSNVIIEFKCL